MILSYWPAHTSGTAEQPVDARRCTVQLSTGRLYLDAVAAAATALLGRDSPPMLATDATHVRQMMSSRTPGYVCVAMTQSFSTAARLAAQIGQSAAATGSVLEINALDGEPAQCDDILVVHENETLGRTGQWLASLAWGRAPDLVVVGEALALGAPFGAVLVRTGVTTSLPSTGKGTLLGYEAAGTGVLAQVAAAITTVESAGLLQQGRELADYLMERLLSMRKSCPQIESVAAKGLCIRITLASPLRAAQIRRGMCERGVLAGVDQAGRLAIDPPLPLRIAEADVITGALRGALLDLPVVTASVCCASCENSS